MNFAKMRSRLKIGLDIFTILSGLMIILCVLAKQWWSLPAWGTILILIRAFGDQEKIIKMQDELIKTQHDLIMNRKSRNGWIEDITPIDN